MAAIANDWLEPLKPEFSKPYYRKLYQTVNEEYRTHQIFPPADDIFNAFALTPLHEVKVVILGQDPYHEPGQAHGLSFSVEPGVAIPKSLVNIYKEMETDLGLASPQTGCLLPWAEHGVLLLNSVLTVEAHKAGSHRKFHWERFTDQVIRATNALPQPIAFVLWGNFAIKKAPLIQSDAPRLVLTSAHPSPLSAYRGFFGSRPFSKINAFLAENGQEPIPWKLT